MDQIASAFVRRAATCTSLQNLFDLLGRTLADIGFPYWAFGAVWGDPEAFGDYAQPAVAMNYPSDWISAYFSAHYERVDPVVLVVPYATGVVQWSDLRHYCPKLFDDAAKYGLGSGLSLPLRTLSGCYVFSLSSQDSANIDLNTQLWVEMIIHGFFSVYLRLRRVSCDDYGLTSNTIEVLRLTMAGRTRKEIAQQLTLSVDGVHWCLKDAKAKLQCRTTEEVLLRAVSLGLLRV